VHDRGVEFMIARGIEHGAMSGIETWVVFQRDDSGLDCVESQATIGEDSPPSPQGIGQPIARRLVAFGRKARARNGPCAAMDHETCHSFIPCPLAASKPDGDAISTLANRFISWNL